MGQRFQVTNNVDTTLTTTDEVVVATLTGVSTNRPGVVVSFRGAARIQSGTATTQMRLRIRRDDLVGTSVGDSGPVTLGAAAGQPESFSMDAQDDTVGEVSGKTYVLTAQQVSATGNGTCQTATLIADTN